MSLADASVVVVNFTFWLCVAYPLTGLYWPWWQTAIGLSVIAKTTALALFLLPYETHFLLGWNVTTPGYQWFSLACFAAVPVILIWRAAAIWVVQKRGASTG